MSFDEFIDYIDKMQVKSHVTTEQVFKKMFNLCDTDGQGGISAKELNDTLNSLGQEMRLLDVMELTKDIDNDGSGELEFHEFKQLMLDLDVAPR